MDTLYIPVCFQSEVDTFLSISGHLADQSLKLRGFDAIFPPKVTEAASVSECFVISIVSHMVPEF
jgi:hypothetical protein